MSSRRAPRRFSAAQAPVSLRDGIVALAQLQPADAPSQEAILDLLGLARPAAKSDAPPVVPPALPVPQATPQAVSPPPGLTARIAAIPAAPIQRPALPLRAQLMRASGVARVQPPWKTAGEVIPREREDKAAPLPSIFAPLEGRGIYTAALSTWVDEGEPDLDRAVSELAHYRPLRVLPRLALRTLRRGVQLLLDTGPNMAPYAADVRALTDELAKLLSGSQMERLFFMRCPTRGVREGPLGRGRTWRSPPRGMPVLAVSDFGIADNLDDDDAASVADWQRFAADVRAEGHPFIGIVPFAADRWSAPLSEAMTLIHWSERTIAGVVDRALREAQRKSR